MNWRVKEGKNRTPGDQKSMLKKLELKPERSKFT